MARIMPFAPQWYTTEDFKDAQPISMYHREQEEDPADPVGIRNYHVLARASFLTADDPELHHVLRISADDYYKLYINGTFVAQGPAAAYPEHYYYNMIDITRYLHAGTNTIAVHLYYQGLLNRVWNSRDGRMGIGSDIMTVRASGGLAAATELLWRYTVTKAFGMGPTVGYETQYMEDFDSRLWDDDWADEGYDIMTWKPMVPAPWADYSFELQPTKMLEMHTLAPAAMRTLDAANFTDSPRIAAKAGTIVRIDFGREITATLSLVARGVAGDVIVIRCGEELNDDGSVRYEMRCNCTYEERWTLADGVSRLVQYDYKAFRYVELLVPRGVELQDIHALERHYPLDKSLCTVESSDPTLEPVFEICKRGVELGTQDAYLDCPSREKGQYLGDSVVISASQVWLSGSLEMLDKCINQFAQTAELVDDGLMADAPGSFMQEIADYSLMWAMMPLARYRMTGDLDSLRAAYPIAKGVLDHFSGYAREDGLLEQVADKWNLVDWPENLRDGYDFELTRPIVAPGCHNVINAIYVGAAKTLCEIEDLLDIPHAYPWEPLRDAYVKAFFRPERGLFVDSETSTHAALHSNMYPLYFGLCPEGSEGAIADFMLNKGLCCGVLLSYFYLKGLARVGRYRDVFESIVNDSEHGWVNMVREGATTCWEAWGRDQKWNTSLCHAWASAPIPVLIEDVAGFVPDPTAPRGFRFEPHVPADLERFYLTVPFDGTVYAIEKNGADAETTCTPIRTYEK